MQADKHICMSNTQPMHKTYMHLGKILQGHKSDVLKENAWHLATSTKATKHGYKNLKAYKSKWLQMYHTKDITNWITSYI